MTEIEYRTNPAVSRSELWQFHKSPEKFKYEKEHPQESSPALLFGRIFHKLVLEPDTFKDEFALPPVVDKRTKAGKLEWQEFLESCGEKTVCPCDIFLQASAMAESVNQVSLAKKLLHGERETPYFWTDKQSGLDCKCRTDCLTMDYSRPIIVDLKSTIDASTDAFTRDAMKYGYDLQAAMYSDGVKANIGLSPLFVFIVVEKSPPYCVNILQADDLFIQRGRVLFNTVIDEYKYCLESGNWYGFLGKDCHINNLSLPEWAAKELI